MPKFDFAYTVIFEKTVTFEAENCQEAWTKAYNFDVDLSNINCWAQEDCSVCFRPSDPEERFL